MVLIVDALTKDFGVKFWNFVQQGKYRSRISNDTNPHFYRFDKPENDSFPKMIELFCNDNFELKEANGLTPVHIDDDISSLSAILLDRDYYSILVKGKTVELGYSVLRPEYLILFKAKAYLDLKRKKENGNQIDSNDIKKHRKDILRISAELILDHIDDLPLSVKEDISVFIALLEKEPYDDNTLKNYGLKNEEIVNVLKKTYL